MFGLNSFGCPAPIFCIGCVSGGLCMTSLSAGYPVRRSTVCLRVFRAALLAAPHARVAPPVSQAARRAHLDEPNSRANTQFMKPCNLKQCCACERALVCGCAAPRICSRARCPCHTVVAERYACWHASCSTPAPPSSSDCAPSLLALDLVLHGLDLCLRMYVSGVSHAYPSQTTPAYRRAYGQRAISTFRPRPWGRKLGSAHLVGLLLVLEGLVVL